jgi:hypothetical protein
LVPEDIGQVSTRNFDWLLFNTPPPPAPVVAFSGPSIGFIAGLVTC